MFRELIIGASGTGKSMLIKALDETITRYLLKIDNEQPEKERVILCASTGKASFNIGGVTLHSAFHLPTKTNDMAPLSVKTVEKIRKELSKLRLVIIDEVFSFIKKTITYL